MEEVIEIRNFVNEFYTVNIDNREALDIAECYQYSNVKPIKEAIAERDLSIGDVLFIARLCANTAVIDYVINHEDLPHNETVYDLLSHFIDNNTLLIFGDRCREKYMLYHISTDDIADIIANM